MIRDLVHGMTRESFSRMKISLSLRYSRATENEHSDHWSWKANEN